MEICEPCNRLGIITLRSADYNSHVGVMEEYEFSTVTVGYQVWIDEEVSLRENGFLNVTHLVDRIMISVEHEFTQAASPHDPSHKHTARVSELCLYFSIKRLLRYLIRYLQPPYNHHYQKSIPCLSPLVSYSRFHIALD